VNKLLEKYGARKVFLEGDAIILAILEREGEPGLAVSRMCVLAREIIEIVRGYNELMQRSGMPGWNWEWASRCRNPPRST
jgi:hypothetical protein